MKKEYPLDTEKSVQPGTLNRMEGYTSETEMNRIRGGIRKYGIPPKCIIPEGISSSNQLLQLKRL